MKDSNIRKEVIRRRQNDNAIAALGWTRRERWLEKAERNTEEDRNRSPKLTSWGCVTRIASNLFSKDPGISLNPCIRTSRRFVLGVKREAHSRYAARRGDFHHERRPIALRVAPIVAGREKGS